MADSKLSNSTKEQQEIWRPIKGYEGVYEISSFGRVKSFKRSKSGRILKTTKASHGYPTVGLFKNNKKETACIHRLVADAFIPNPDSHELVLHKDDVRDNNVLSNLYWGGYKQNTQDRINNFGVSSLCKNAKLTERDVKEIRSKYKNSKLSKHELADVYNVSWQTIYEVVTGLTWNHI